MGQFNDVLYNALCSTVQCSRIEGVWSISLIRGCLSHCWRKRASLSAFNACITVLNLVLSKSRKAWRGCSLKNKITLAIAVNLVKLLWSAVENELALFLKNYAIIDMTLRPS